MVISGAELTAGDPQTDVDNDTGIGTLLHRTVLLYIIRFITYKPNPIKR